VLIFYSSSTHVKARFGVLPIELQCSTPPSDPAYGVSIINTDRDVSIRLTPELDWWRHQTAETDGTIVVLLEIWTTYLLQDHVSQLVLVHRLTLEVEVEVKAWGNHGIRRDVDLTAVEGG